MSIKADRMWERGDQLHWFDSAVNATSLYLKFPLMIGKAYEQLVKLVSQLSQSQDHCGFSWVCYESMKRRRALKQMMHMPQTLCAHGWAQLVQPTGGKRVLWFQSRCWKQPFGGAGWHESEIDNPHPPSEKKISSCLTLLHFFILVSTLVTSRLYLMTTEA